MKIEEIETDQRFMQFLNSRAIRKSTIKEYKFRTKTYCNFIGKTPSELIQEARDEQIEQPWISERKISKYLTDFLNYLRDSNKSENYIASTMSTVNSFYRHFEIQIPDIRIKASKNEQLITTKDIVQKVHISKVLDYCNLKYKSIILLMSSSGMGQSEIINLTYNDFLNAISEYYKPADNELFDIYLISQKLEEYKEELIGTWEIQRYKTGKGYFTFSSPESIQIIISYLIDRILQNKPVKSLDDWLFESNGKKMSINTVGPYFKNLNDRCEFGYVGNQRFFTSHKLRKYFASTLHKNKIPELTTHWLLGHRVDAVTEAYFKADINSLKEQYKTVVEDLSIENVVLREVTTEGYDKLLKKIERLEKRQALIDKLQGDQEYLDKVSKIKTS